jgi:hypothetical protein
MRRRNIPLRFEINVYTPPRRRQVIFRRSATQRGPHMLRRTATAELFSRNLRLSDYLTRARPAAG